MGSLNLHSWTQSFWIFFICAHLKNVFATQGEERYSAGILIVDRFLVLPYGGFLLCILVLFFPMYGFKGGAVGERPCIQVGN